MFELSHIAKSLWRNKFTPALMVLQLTVTYVVVSYALAYMFPKLDFISRTLGLPEKELIFVRSANIGNEPSPKGYVEKDLEAIKSIGGVVDVVPTCSLPLYSELGYVSVGVANDGIGTLQARELGSTTSTLKVMDLKLLQGRNFSEDEIQNHQSSDQQLIAPTIISQHLAKSLFGFSDPVGRVIYTHYSRGYKVVGVIGDFLSTTRDVDFASSIMLVPVSLTGASKRYIVRVEPGRGDEVISQVEDKLLKHHQHRVIYDLVSLASAKNMKYGVHYAVIDLTLVVITFLAFTNALGVYGLTSFSVHRRKNQIGIRRALGASKLDIFRYFILESGVICISALLAGVLLSVLINSYLADSLNIQKLSITYLTYSAIIVLVLNFTASWVPASQAANKSPSIASQKNSRSSDRESI